VTDRIHSITIALEKDIREDDIESLIQALKHFRYVIDVKPNICDAKTHSFVLEERLRREYEKRLWNALNESESYI
jgi:hypothetical protein